MERIQGLNEKVASSMDTQVIKNGLQYDKADKKRFERIRICGRFGVRVTSHPSESGTEGALGTLKPGQFALPVFRREGILTPKNGQY